MSILVFLYIFTITHMSPLPNTSSIGQEVRNVVLLVNSSEEMSLGSNSVDGDIFSSMVTGTLRSCGHEPVLLVLHVILGDVVPGVTK